MPSDLTALAAELAPRALDEMGRLVAVSTPSGSFEESEAAIQMCIGFLPAAAVVERPACATVGCAPDLLATITGTGGKRVLLLGHVDTVVRHAEHQSLRADGDRLYGSGTADMKGGVAVALALARVLAQERELFAELSILLVCDEEWRTAPFLHAERFAGYDACLCFEAGERTPDGEEGVIVKRKGAGTLRVRALGRAAHSGAAPERGRNALLALAHAAITVVATHDPGSAERMTVVPTVMRSGEAFNVVPAGGELIFDIRSDDTSSFERVVAAVPDEVGGATLEPVMERVWPAMDARDVTAPLLERASVLLGRRIVGRGRGGASDASHFAPLIPFTVDGLGPRGGGAHTPEEFVYQHSVGERIAVALAVAHAVLR
jgi:glutamate carboxypeptidase